MESAGHQPQGSHPGRGSPHSRSLHLHCTGPPALGLLQPQLLSPSLPNSQNSQSAKLPRPVASSHTTSICPLGTCPLDSTLSQWSRQTPQPRGHVCPEPPSQGSLSPLPTALPAPRMSRRQSMAHLCRPLPPNPASPRAPHPTHHPGDPARGHLPHLIPKAPKLPLSPLPPTFSHSTALRALGLLTPSSADSWPTPTSLHHPSLSSSVMTSGKPSWVLAPPWAPFPLRVPS